MFFLLVGREIKRELIAGELASRQQAALPIAGALGGVAVPAFLYWLITMGTPGARGWGIPMATDIAFALGTLSLVARHAPTGAKMFLAALAIVDDMGAVLISALFYSNQIVWSAVLVAALTVVALVALNRLGIRHLTPYLLLGLVLWFFIHESGERARSFASRWKRANRSRSLANGSGSTLIATSRSSAVSRADTPRPCRYDR